MKKQNLIILVLIVSQHLLFCQCNLGLNLGAVIVPTHGNSSNAGNFTVAAAWQQASNYIDTFNLDYRQRYITWKNVVSQITGNVPTFSFNSTFENNLEAWSGNPDVHIVYPIIKVGVPNTLEDAPTGAPTFTTFLDTAYISQNYKAVSYILSNVNNVKWISLGNEIETYFGGANLNDGQLTMFAQFLSIMKTKINTDFPTVKVGTVLAFHTLTFNSELNMIDSVKNVVDYLGYTFYYTTNSSGNCWDSPATVQTWLDMAKQKSSPKKILLTETCMGDGGGTSQNCGSSSKQLAYADTLLRWYKNNMTNVEGMTWFTITDPYLGWQTPNTLWNNSGLVDSNGVTQQPAATLWRHQCTTTKLNETNLNELSFSLFPNPFNNTIQINLPEQFANELNKISVYNIVGEGVAEFSFHGNAYKCDLTKFTNGIYYFKFENNKRVSVQKAFLNR